ncbi:hypothetical protein H6P81_015770 [Aristolochia fimbriata]|uniref:Uncharacterized protein n=1 Tax=Aristolochia fimbriata TaxID=158543 RepID=A0AAV7E8J5_ARIFI|nr:hypothetical protein H6P81_015770 [Aristolochia fimbriata]
MGLCLFFLAFGRDPNLSGQITWKSGRGTWCKETDKANGVWTKLAGCRGTAEEAITSKEVKMGGSQAPTSLLLVISLAVGVPLFVAVPPPCVKETQMLHMGLRLG